MPDPYVPEFNVNPDGSVVLNVQLDGFTPGNSAEISGYITQTSGAFVPFLTSKRSPIRSKALLPYGESSAAGIGLGSSGHGHHAGGGGKDLAHGAECGSVRGRLLDLGGKSYSDSPTGTPPTKVSASPTLPPPPGPAPDRPGARPARGLPGHHHVGGARIRWRHDENHIYQGQAWRGVPYPGQQITDHRDKLLGDGPAKRHQILLHSGCSRP